MHRKYKDGGRLIHAFVTGCGETAIDRVAQAIKGKKLAPVVMPLINQFVAQEVQLAHSGTMLLGASVKLVCINPLVVILLQDWKFRHTGLYGLHRRK